MLPEAQARRAAARVRRRRKGRGGIGQSRTVMSLLKKAHLGEVSATVWPSVLKEMCRKRNVHVIE